jgi:hypothetical protein
MVAEYRPPPLSPAKASILIGSSAGANASCGRISSWRSGVMTTLSNPGMATIWVYAELGCNFSN